MAEPDRRKRPFGVIVITILQLIFVFTLIADIILLQDGKPSFVFRDVPSSYLLLTIEVIVIFYQLITILGFWMLKRWAWFLIMVQLGGSMVFDLWAYYNGVHFYLNMIRNILVVFYLNQREVQDVFEKKRHLQEIA